MVPEYGEGYKCKIVLPGVVDGSRYSIFSIVVQDPAGQSKKVRLTPDAYLGIVAATNFKQRARKMTEYHYADLRQYAVAGTPNRLEYELGFFVKNGDGAADFKPIAHLYKSQVYRLAALSGSTAGDPTAAADHRHLSAGSISGRVLLYGPARKDGPLFIRKKQRNSCSGFSRDGSYGGSSSRPDLSPDRIYTQGCPISPGPAGTVRVGLIPIR